MKIYVRVEDGEQNYEAELEFPEAQAAELRHLQLLLGRYYYSGAVKPVTLASIIPGLVSIGSDTFLQEFHKKMLKDHLGLIRWGT